MTNMLKCRLCSWQIKPRWRNKNGQLIDGMQAVVDHYLRSHEYVLDCRQIKAILDRGEATAREGTG